MSFLSQRPRALEEKRRPSGEADLWLTDAQQEAKRSKECRVAAVAMMNWLSLECMLS